MSFLRSVFYLSLRTLAFGAGFLLMTLIFYLCGNKDYLLKASSWWPVYGLFANLLCFLVILIKLRQENTSFLRLVNFRREKLRKDILLSIVFIFFSVVIAVSASVLFGFAIYGRYPYDVIPLFTGIPVIVVIIFAIIFPIVNSVLEEITYNGYLFPALETKIRSTNAVILIILFFFTIQHVFVMFLPDVKYLSWRLLCFVPLLLFWIIIYKKMRRLTSLIIVHWFMDTFAIVSIIFAPVPK